MDPHQVDEIFRILAAANPEPQTELRSVNHYTLLVAVVLSAQMTDVGVNKATKALFEVVSTPEEMVALGEEDLKSYIKTINLYNTKARNVIGLSQKLIEEHHSEVPSSFDALIKLPGVGVKTANVLLNCAFGEETIAVDTHVFRVSNRIGLVSTKTAEKTEVELQKVIPAHWKRHAHHWLILHGRYICKARKPECFHCPIAHLCEFEGKVGLG